MILRVECSEVRREREKSRDWSMRVKFGKRKRDQILVASFPSSSTTLSDHGERVPTTTLTTGERSQSCTRTTLPATVLLLRFVRSPRIKRFRPLCQHRSTRILDELLTMVTGNRCESSLNPRLLSTSQADRCTRNRIRALRATLPASSGVNVQTPRSTTARSIAYRSVRSSAVALS